MLVFCLILCVSDDLTTYIYDRKGKYILENKNYGISLSKTGLQNYEVEEVVNIILKHKTKIQVIDLSFNNSLTGDSLIVLTHLQSLKSIHINNTEMLNDDIEELHNFPHLERLDISNLHIDDDCVKAINKIKKLKILNIRGTGITKKGLMELNNNKKLEMLFINKICVDEVDIKNFINKNPNCKVFDMPANH